MKNNENDNDSNDTAPQFSLIRRAIFLQLLIASAAFGKALSVLNTFSGKELGLPTLRIDQMLRLEKMTGLLIENLEIDSKLSGGEPLVAAACIQPLDFFTAAAQKEGHQTFEVRYISPPEMPARRLAYLEAVTQLGDQLIAATSLGQGRFIFECIQGEYSDSKEAFIQIKLQKVI